MRVMLAESMGLCFGVRDALTLTSRIAQPELVTIHGELVHNEAILQQLDLRGFRRQAEVDQGTIPESPQVLVTAHGISDRERTRLLEAGKQLIDATCPLVRRAHQAALSLAAEGRHVVVIGIAKHVEVRGLVGDLDEFTVVQDDSDVRSWPALRLGVVCQTTSPPAQVNRLLQLIRTRNPHADVRFIDTVCQPTIDRQSALERLLPQVDAVVVVGGRNSNNTRRLVELCRSQGVSTYQVQSPGDLDPDWFAGCRVVGLSAGTSTPDALIQEVADSLRRCAPSGARAWGPRESGYWCRHFRRGAVHQRPVRWDTVGQLTAEERRTVARSIAVFQLGESGEGTHLLACAASHAARVGDPHYVLALRAFVREEQRHAELLGRFLDLAGSPRITRHWSNGYFRWLRRQAGLELTLTVLVTAEILAHVYYHALHDATQCPALRDICRQLLHDEVAHVRFQRERIEVLQQRCWRVTRRIKRMLHWGLYLVTACVLWFGHRSVFCAAGLRWRGYWLRALRAFRRSRAAVR